MAQIPKKAPKVLLSFQMSLEQAEEIDAVVKAEGLDVISRPDVIEHLVKLGLQLYWARHDVGHEKIDAVIAEHGGDARRAYAELLGTKMEIERVTKSIRESTEQMKRERLEEKQARVVARRGKSKT